MSIENKTKKRKHRVISLLQKICVSICFNCLSFLVSSFSLFSPPKKKIEPIYFSSRVVCMYAFLKETCSICVCVEKKNNKKKQNETKKKKRKKEFSMYACVCFFSVCARFICRPFFVSCCCVPNCVFYAVAAAAAACFPIYLLCDYVCVCVYQLLLSAVCACARALFTHHFIFFVHYTP